MLLGRSRLVRQPHGPDACTTCPEQGRARDITQVHEATIEALAKAIDAYDEPADDHVRRVRLHAEALARHVGLSLSEIEAVKSAAVLHDIGKLGVPAHILAKPGPLTAEEFDRVRVHPRLGAEIIEAVPFPYPVAPLILCHHERWDGRGYPSGLRGDGIPLGARVLAVVDCFDSLTRRRPYRGPVDRESALEILRYEAGKSLDPAVVDAYIELLPTLEGSEAREPLSEPLVPRPVNAGRALQAIAYAHRESVALYELSRTISRGLGVTETGHLLATGLVGLIPHASCALFVPTSDDRLVCSFVCGIDADIVRGLVITPGVGPIGEAVAMRMTLVNGDPQAGFAASGVSSVPSRSSLRSMLATPLVVDEVLVGTLVLFHHEPDFYGEDHRRVMEHVASHAAVVVQNARHFDQAREDALTDPLTGLPNTRFLLMHLTQELARASRQGSELALLVMDLDDFKKVNDSAGHWAGDQVLCEVARALLASVRPYDVCARYAGDEFLIMLPECGLAEAEDRRHQLEQTVRSVSVEVGRGRRLSVTASVGAAVFPSDGDTYESLLAAADARMYARKHGSRRAVSVTSSDERSAAGAA